MFLFGNFSYTFFLFLIIVFVFAVFLIFYYKNKFKKKLTKLSYLKFQKKIKLLDSSSFSSREKIIEYDKYYHIILKEVGYVGDFGSILKQNISCIQNIDKIWELHKLRNNLVHSTFDFDEKFLEKKAKEYKIEIEKLLNNLK